jgi:uncharacterized protein YndB with AHSA1/START domain
MKKRVLAALLAVCMIAATCVLFASAEGDITFTKNSYVQNGDNADTITWGTTTLGDLQDSEQIKATLKPKTSGAQLSASLADHPGNFDYEDLTKIADVSTGNAYFYQAYQISGVTITPSSDGKTATVKVTVSVNSDASDDRVYQVGSSDINGNSYDTLQQGDFASASGAYKYRINGKNSDTITIYNVKLVEQLHSLSMGLQFYGDHTYTNISASEIAQIESRYTLIDGNGLNKGTEIVSHVNSIYDLYEGQRIQLTAKLKDPKDAEDYGFKCWVDGSNNIIEKTPTIYWEAGSDPSPIYAVFEEKKGRVRINYSWEGEGAIAYQESTSNDKVLTRSLLNKTDGQHTDNNTTYNNGQISVLQGHTVTFVFTPKEGYEVSHVYVDRKGTGTKIDVASFKSIILNDGFGPSLAALKEMISATGANRTFTIEADKNRQEQIYYKFTFTSDDTTGEANNIRSIHVEFAPIKVYEAPTGKELPTVEPEGVTLATGAAPENAEGANGGAATTLPPENGAAGANGASPLSGSVVNPATGSGSGTGAIAVFTTLSLAAAGAFVTVKKRNKED